MSRLEHTLEKQIDQWTSIGLFCLKEGVGEGNYQSRQGIIMAMKQSMQQVGGK